MTTENPSPARTSLSPLTPTVWPSVGFTDIDAATHLLTEVLGFVITAMYRDDDGVVQHAEARWPDGGGIMFGSRGKPNEWGQLGPQGVYIAAAEAATVDAVYQRVTAEDSLEVLRKLTDTDYGSHEFDFRDRDGNLWSIGTYLGE